MDAQSQDLEKLHQLIKDIQIGMMTTMEKGGWMHSRPMATVNREFDGELWFFTREHSPKVDEVQQDRHVCVSYASDDRNSYASVSGRAELVLDKQKMAEMWNPVYKAWFPKGLEDPEIALLRVKVEKAEYWDMPHSAAVKVFGFAKAVLTGKPYEPGENKKLDLDRH